MFSSHRQSYISQLSRSYPILRHVDIYDRQSFLRAYVLDNIYICILTYAIFYAALWYANTVIKRIEKSNRELLKIVEENRTKLADVAALKDKKTEYEEVILKTKEAQQLTSKYLETEMRKLSSEIATAGDKMSELESLVKKYKSSGKPGEGRAEEGDGLAGTPEQRFKILTPSFPPPVPPEPPPRKYGIFVSRPPGQRGPHPGPAPVNSPPKVGFK